MGSIDLLLLRIGARHTASLDTETAQRICRCTTENTCVKIILSVIIASSALSVYIDR